MLRELEKLLPHDIWPHWNRSFWFDVDSDGGPALVTADEIRAVICLHATRVGLRGDIEDGFCVPSGAPLSEGRQLKLTQAIESATVQLNDQLRMRQPDFE